MFLACGHAAVAAMLYGTLGIGLAPSSAAAINTWSTASST